jgi:LysR family transcriptional regulator, glycine cleavage system transcriptional activator
MRRPRLNVLRSFEAAARHQSFARAADELHISPAAVSQQMRHLEAHLGAPLFTRHHRRISLSATGRTYFEAVHDALGQLDAATDRLFGAPTQPVVVIKCTSSVATLWLAPEIGAFRAAHPGIDLHFHTQENDDTATAPACDLEILVAPTPPPDRQVQPLLTASISPVAAPGYLDHRLENAQDILGLNLIHVLGYDDGWQRWFARYGLGERAVPRGLAADSSLFAIDAALRGDGVFLGRRPFIDRHLDSGQLVEVFSRPHTLQADYYLRQHAGAGRARDRDTVSAWLRALAAAG